MQRVIPVLALAVLAAVPAQAQDAAADDRAGELQIVARAMEAHIRIGDTLRENGDVDGALRSYRQAITLFEEARRRSGLTPKEPTVRLRGAVGRALPGRTGRRPGTAHAVKAGLKWLAKHQGEDGRWASGEGSSRVKRPVFHDTGVTALALLAFLGAGHTDRGEQAFAGNVRNGLRYLLTLQDEEGCFGTRASQHFMYGHAMATLALCEAYAATKNPRFKKPAQKGLDFIAMARNPYLAWRYEPRGGENDTSVTVWCVMALKSGRSAGLKVDPAAFVGARAWIDKMTDPEFGRVGYNLRGGSVARLAGMQDRFPPDKSEAMTAAGVLCRILGGEDARKSEPIRKGASLMLAQPPRWDADAGTIDMYYWYLGSLAMFQVGGNDWRRWSASLRTAVLESQQQGAGPKAGSWDPIGAWGTTGGRVYSTAMMTMCAEIFLRYDRAVQR
ncbi:MAG: prenyltransferase/squalene oxidase repeat-containing protein [Planctomycetota bacterium]|jgi:hypothetical protein